MDKVAVKLANQSDKLYYYSPYHYITRFNPVIQSDKLVSKTIADFYQNPNHSVIEIAVNNHIHYFFLLFLPWDTEHFQVPTYKVFIVLCQHSQAALLAEAINIFKNSFVPGQKKYCFIELPSEDILLLQAFTWSGFRLIETRLSYYKENVQLYENERFPVRRAIADDIPALRKVALEHTNPYDRIHADNFFSAEKADNYLATYAEQAVKGFADTVIVPDVINLPIDAFAAISYLEKDSQILGCQLSRILLTAVGPASRGWHYKLVSESVYQAKLRGANYLLMTTQTTNRAVIRNCEKLGFRFGACSHILSYYTQ